MNTLKAVDFSVYLLVCPIFRSKSIAIAFDVINNKTRHMNILIHMYVEWNIVCCILYCLFSVLMAFSYALFVGSFQCILQTCVLRHSITNIPNVTLFKCWWFSYWWTWFVPGKMIVRKKPFERKLERGRQSPIFWLGRINKIYIWLTCKTVLLCVSTHSISLVFYVFLPGSISYIPQMLSHFIRFRKMLNHF